jgi:hypothetical protein
MDHIAIACTRGTARSYILAGGGEAIAAYPTERERFAAVLGPQPPARVLVEASTASEWG